MSEDLGFKRSFEKRKCLAPAGGFYEWKKVGATKIPHRIHLKDGLWMGFAMDFVSASIRDANKPEMPSGCLTAFRSVRTIVGVTEGAFFGRSELDMGNVGLG